MSDPTLNRLYSAIAGHVNDLPRGHVPAHIADIWLKSLSQRSRLPIFGDPEVAAQLMQRLEGRLRQHVRLTYQRPRGVERGADGAYNHGNRWLFVDPSMEVRRMFSVMLHELAHHLTYVHIPQMVRVGSEGFEVIAESVACVVCARCGLDTVDQSASYLAPYTINDGRNPRSYERVVLMLADHLERLVR